MFDIYLFLKYNLKYLPVKLGSSIQDVKMLYGEPLEQVGNDDMGWLYYKGGTRLTYLEGFISEVGIELIRSKKKYKFINNDKKTTGIVDSKTKILEMLKVLISSGIKYKFLNTIDNNSYISVVTEGDVGISMYIELDEVNLINYTGNLSFNQIPTLEQLLTAAGASDRTNV